MGATAPDDVLKTELKTAGCQHIMAFDDRDHVVKTWCSNGVPRPGRGRGVPMMMRGMEFCILALASLAQPALAQADLHEITEEKAVACKTREDLEELIRFAGENDDQAYFNFLNFSVVGGRCRLLKAGTRVTVEERAARGSFARVSRVRVKGELFSYWIGDDDYR